MHHGYKNEADASENATDYDKNTQNQQKTRSRPVSTSIMLITGAG
jgi:hypothetical protein